MDLRDFVADNDGTLQLRDPNKRSRMPIVELQDERDELLDLLADLVSEDKDVREIAGTRAKQRLEDFEAREKAELLTHDGKPIALTLAGVESPEFRRAVDERQVRHNKVRRPASRPMTSAEVAADAVEFLSGVVKGWSVMPMGPDALLEFNPQNLRKVLSLRWVRDQIDGFYGDRANFTKPASRD